MSIMRFSIPRDIIYGEDALAELTNLKGKKAAIVTGGSSMKRFGFLDQCQKYLAEAGMESIIIDGVEPNPSVATVWRGAEAMIQFEPDWIVAIGGGSALDAAKVMWCFYEHPQLRFEDIIEVGSMPHSEIKQNSLRFHPQVVRRLRLLHSLLSLTQKTILSIRLLQLIWCRTLQFLIRSYRKKCLHTLQPIQEWMC